MRRRFYELFAADASRLVPISFSVWVARAVRVETISRAGPGPDMRETRLGPSLRFGAYEPNESRAPPGRERAHSNGAQREYCPVMARYPRIVASQEAT